jgi:hypothetical protein
MVVALRSTRNLVFNDRQQARGSLYCFNPFLSTPTPDTRGAGNKGLTKGAWTRDLSLSLFRFGFR